MLDTVNTDDLAMPCLTGNNGIQYITAYDTPPESPVQLFTLAPIKQLVFAAGNDGITVSSLQDLRASIEAKIPPKKQLALELSYEASHIEVSTDESLLYVASADEEAYTVSSYLLNGSTLAEEPSSVFQIGPVAAMKRRPHHRSVAVLTSDGKLISLPTREVIAEEGIKSFDWSTDGNVIYLARQSSIIKMEVGASSMTMSPPDLADTESIYALFCLKSNICLVITHNEEDDEHSYRAFLENEDNKLEMYTGGICPGWGQRQWSWFASTLSHWPDPNSDKSLTFVCAENAVEVAIIGLEGTYQIVEDEYSPAIPLSEDDLECSPVGMVLDLSATEMTYVGIKGNEHKAAVPTLWILTNAGALAAWKVVSRSALINNQLTLDLVANVLKASHGDALQDSGDFLKNIKSDDVDEPFANVKSELASDAKGANDGQKIGSPEVHNSSSFSTDTESAETKNHIAENESSEPPENSAFSVATNLNSTAKPETSKNTGGFASLIPQSESTKKGAFSFTPSTSFSSTGSSGFSSSFSQHSGFPSKDSKAGFGAFGQSKFGSIAYGSNFSSSSFGSYAGTQAFSQSTNSNAFTQNTGFSIFDSETAKPAKDAEDVTSDNAENKPDDSNLQKNNETTLLVNNASGDVDKNSHAIKNASRDSGSESASLKEPSEKVKRPDPVEVGLDAKSTLSAGFASPVSPPSAGFGFGSTREDKEREARSPRLLSPQSSNPLSRSLHKSNTRESSPSIPDVPTPQYVHERRLELHGISMAGQQQSSPKRSSTPIELSGIERPHTPSPPVLRNRDTASSIGGTSTVTPGSGSPVMAPLIPVSQAFSRVSSPKIFQRISSEDDSTTSSQSVNKLTTKPGNEPSSDGHLDNMEVADEGKIIAPPAFQDSDNALKVLPSGREADPNVTAKAAQVLDDKLKDPTPPVIVADPVLQEKQDINLKGGSANRVRSRLDQSVTRDIDSESETESKSEESDSESGSDSDFKLEANEALAAPERIAGEDQIAHDHDQTLDFGHDAKDDGSITPQVDSEPGSDSQTESSSSTDDHSITLDTNEKFPEQDDKKELINFGNLNLGNDGKENGNQRIESTAVESAEMGTQTEERSEPMVSIGISAVKETVDGGLQTDDTVCGELDLPSLPEAPKCMEQDTFDNIYDSVEERIAILEKFEESMSRYIAWNGSENYNASEDGLSIFETEVWKLRMAGKIGAYANSLGDKFDKDVSELEKLLDMAQTETNSLPLMKVLIDGVGGQLQAYRDANSEIQQMRAPPPALVLLRKRLRDRMSTLYELFDELQCSINLSMPTVADAVGKNSDPNRITSAAVKVSSAIENKYLEMENLVAKLAKLTFPDQKGLKSITMLRANASNFKSVQGKRNETKKSVLEWAKSREENTVV